ncbi:SUF system NifU family Fe-S cluster assembly protein [Candidatus Marinamargulisbacteria bacterium SCGC AAA071-K20]|nr:SUF system NifU family Fe-S cluster assembly protein [Candidatus Marinamargulisbacteria bacterium SCGC AAA071-K20]
MSRIQKLYESMILEHNKNPRNFKEMIDCTHQSHGHNPLCGDDYFVYIKVKDDRLEDISFQGQGCAISKSSGSLMTEFLKGKSLDECKAVKDLFLNLVTKELTFEDKEKIGKLKVFEGVKQFPIRVKCAALVWRALEQAMSEGSDTIKTE